MSSTEEWQCHVLINPLRASLLQSRTLIHGTVSLPIELACESCSLSRYHPAVFPTQIPTSNEIARLPFTARIELRLNAILFIAFSEVADCGLHARIGQPPLYRGGSASIETTPATSPFPSEATCCRARKMIRLHSLLRCLVPLILCVFPRGWPGRSSSARVERAHSDRARSASRRTTRLPSHPHLQFSGLPRTLNCRDPAWPE